MLSAALETSQRLDFFTVGVKLRVLHAASVGFCGAGSVYSYWYYDLWPDLDTLLNTKYKTVNDSVKMSVGIGSEKSKNGKI